jgi:membrane protease YdiL (CAAX protease family)
MAQAKPIALFLALVLASAVLIESAILAFGFTRLLVTALMWSIGLSALTTLTLLRLPLASLGWSWGPAWHHLIAFTLPIAYGAVAYFGVGTAGLAEFPTAEGTAALVEAQNFTGLGPHLGLLAALLLTATAGLVTAMATGLGEEIGWRGFLTPRLTAAFGFVVATLVTGLIWASWHLPILVFSDYNAGGDTCVEMASFVVMVVAISGVFAWLRLSSGSLWPAVTMHASHNLFIQNVFDPLTTRGDGAITMLSEFGVALAITAVVFSIPFWIMGARMPRERAA